MQLAKEARPSSDEQEPKAKKHKTKDKEKDSMDKVFVHRRFFFAFSMNVGECGSDGISWAVSATYRHVLHRCPPNASGVSGFQ